MSDPVVILGLGFTTQRLARRLRQRGRSVSALVRNPDRFAELAALGVGFSPDQLPKDAVLVHSVPPLADPERSALRASIRDLSPRRVLYISSTGVYGAQTHVSEETPPAPNDDKGCARIDEEEWLSRLPSSVLILRSAAIYGPGRGIHVRLREGRLQSGAARGAGGMVSRIQVDDLAAILETGVDASIEGAWPVADEHPAPSDEVVAWCANRMRLAMPDALAFGSPVAGRSVNGRKIVELMGVKLKYPSYKEGIEASLVEERPNRK